VGRKMDNACGLHLFDYGFGYGLSGFVGEIEGLDGWSGENGMFGNQMTTSGKTIELTTGITKHNTIATVDAKNFDRISETL
jgi:hypothetical protein